MNQNDYDILLNQYHILSSQLNALREQVEIKERMWGDESSKNKVTDDNMRKFCETVLAKDHREMALGENKSWHSYSTDDLIKRARQSFQQYNTERTKLLHEIMEESERRGHLLDCMADRLSRYERGEGMVHAQSQEELEKSLEQEMKEKETYETAKNNVSNRLKQSVEEGNTELIIQDDDDIDLVEQDIAQMMEKNVRYSTHISGGTRILKPKEKEEKLGEVKSKVVAKIVDIDKIIESATDVHKRLIEVVGDTGSAKLTDIIDKIVHEDNNALKQKYRTGAMFLCGMGVFEKETLNLPLTPRAMYVRFTDVGKEIYRKLFKKDPVLSEITTVCAEHTSAEHGFGIMELQKILEETGEYKTVNSFNRKHPISVTIKGEKLKYIPDIVCIDAKKGYTRYIEYECGNHKQEDFNMKCNKMCMVTKYLYFICPNQDITARIKKQVERWVESRGVDSLKGVILKIASARNIKDKKPWDYTYKFSQSAKPIEK